MNLRLARLDRRCLFADIKGPIHLLIDLHGMYARAVVPKFQTTPRNDDNPRDRHQWDARTNTADIIQLAPDRPRRARIVIILSGYDAQKDRLGWADGRRSGRARRRACG